MTPDIKRLRSDLGQPTSRPHPPAVHRDAHLGVANENPCETGWEPEWYLKLIFWILAVVGAGLVIYYVVIPLLMILFSLFLTFLAIAFVLGFLAALLQ